jgi:hypothetical protein
MLRPRSARLTHSHGLVFPRNRANLISNFQGSTKRKEGTTKKTARDRRLSIALHPSTQIAGTR